MFVAFVCVTCSLPAENKQGKTVLVSFLVLLLGFAFVDVFYVPHPVVPSYFYNCHPSEDGSATAVLEN